MTEPKSYDEIYLNFLKSRGLKELEFFIGDYEDNRTVVVKASELLNK